MFTSQSLRIIVAELLGAGVLLSAGLVRPMLAQEKEQESTTANLTVEVKDSESGQPLSQARLTLQFQERGNINQLKLPKKLSYSAKTNAQGRYKFTNINKGPIRLFVTAERHQSFGKEYQLEKDNQVIEVKLKKPQPLL
jgi:Flp pilus assembly protein CpaB